LFKMKNAQILSCHAGLIETILGGHEFRRYFEKFNLNDKSKYTIFSSPKSGHQRCH
jgi:hypothetical protein